jgi:hypothetical protein
LSTCGGERTGALEQAVSEHKANAGSRIVSLSGGEFLCDVIVSPLHRLELIDLTL